MNERNILPDADSALKKALGTNDLNVVRKKEASNQNFGLEQEIKVTKQILPKIFWSFLNSLYLNSEFEY